MDGPGFELWTSCTGRANATHTPTRQNTLAALTESSCKRRVQHGSGELLAPLFFAHVSPPAGAYNALKFFYVFCSMMVLHTPSQLFETVECQHRPQDYGAPQQGKPLSQLWQLMPTL